MFLDVHESLTTQGAPLTAPGDAPLTAPGDAPMTASRAALENRPARLNKAAHNPVAHNPVSQNQAIVRATDSAPTGRGGHSSAGLSTSGSTPRAAKLVANVIATVALAISLLAGVTLSAHAQQTASDDEEVETVLQRERVVAVESTDTLRSLSKTWFGTAGLWRHIAEYNSLDPAVPLLDGQFIKVPVAATVPRQFARIIYSHGNNTITRAPFERSGLIKAGTNSAPSGQPEPLKKGDKVYINDTITTAEDGFISIEFNGGSSANLEPSTAMTLTTLDCPENADQCLIALDVPEGVLGVDVTPRDGQTTGFQITSPYATAAVRGTSFDFSAEEGILLVGVTEGNVDVIAFNQPLNIEQGFGVKTEEGEAPGKPVALLDAPAFFSHANRLTSEDQVSWGRSGGAAAYRVALTSDEAGQQVLQSANVENEAFLMPDLTPGNYYLTVRALDPDGMAGFERQVPLTVAGVDPDAPVAALNITDNGTTWRISVSDANDAAGGYEFQFADNDSFINPITVESGPAGAVVIAKPESIEYVRARAVFTPSLVSLFSDALIVQ